MLFDKHGDPNEIFLYHGTSIENIENIQNEGFNRSYCGKNGN